MGIRCAWCALLVAVGIGGDRAGVGEPVVDDRGIGGDLSLSVFCDVDALHVDGGVHLLVALENGSSVALDLPKAYAEAPSTSYQWRLGVEGAWQEVAGLTAGCAVGSERSLVSFRPGVVLHSHHYPILDSTLGDEVEGSSGDNTDIDRLIQVRVVMSLSLISDEVMLGDDSRGEIEPARVSLVSNVLDLWCHSRDRSDTVGLASYAEGRAILLESAARASRLELLEELSKGATSDRERTEIDLAMSKIAEPLTFAEAQGVCARYMAGGWADDLLFDYAVGMNARRSEGLVREYSLVVSESYPGTTGAMQAAALLREGMHYLDYSSPFSFQ